jgi:hypothetical protein
MIRSVAADSMRRTRQPVAGLHPFTVRFAGSILPGDERGKSEAGPGVPTARILKLLPALGGLIHAA